MAVKTLNVNFRHFYSNLNNHKLIVVICKLVSIIKVPHSFLMQPKLIRLAVLSCNYWSFDSNATRFHKIFSKFLDVFVSLVLLELLSHYHNIDSPNRLMKEFHWIIDKSFRGVLFNWLRHFPLALFY